MKPGIFVVLCIISTAGCIPACAEDTPEQAAARAALEEKMSDLDQQGAALSSDTNSPTAAAEPAESATNMISTVTTNEVTLPNASASTAPTNDTTTAIVPSENASAQAAALAALEQEMEELNQEDARQASETRSAIVATATNLAPANESSAAAAPVTETPTAEIPVAKSPPVARTREVSLATAPAIATPAPEVPTAPATAAAVVAVPTAVPGSVAAPTITPATVVPATPTLPPSAPGQARPTNELVSLSGAIYKNVEVVRVTTDAILISYTPSKGGWAMKKVYFQDLPPAIRQQYEKH